MRVTMIKKQFENGETCQKCSQAEDLLTRRGLWDRIDEVVWAVEGDPSSPGMALAKAHDVALAPFFLVERDGDTSVYTSVLRLVNDVLAPARGEEQSPEQQGAPNPVDVSALATELRGGSPEVMVDRALQLFGKDCVVAFSGAEDVALIDMAVRTGRPFSVLTLDTGRLHPETYRFIERVRSHFGVSVDVLSPEPLPLEALVRSKGLFSFYTDGHGECCGIRKVGPLRRGLRQYRSWMTGQRRDQSPTRSEVATVQLDPSHPGRDGAVLIKWNPLAEWSLTQVWSYIRERELPYNPLHDQGFVSIGCEPCTRAVRPGEHERAGRWWWEDATKRECGLHIKT